MQKYFSWTILSMLKKIANFIVNFVFQSFTSLTIAFLTSPSENSNMRNSEHMLPEKKEGESLNLGLEFTRAFMSSACSVQKLIISAW